jgi:hypothetical protein
MIHSKNLKLKNIPYPVLTNLRNSKKKIKNITGKIHLQLDCENDFVFNSSFNEKKIKYYKNYNNEQSNSSIFQKHLSNIIKILKTKFVKDSKIIEIGCGKGTFFKFLEKNFRFVRGFDTTYDGKSKKILKRYVTDNDVIDEELIILRHTLEHIPNPYDFLNFLKTISINDPYVLIEVPDFNWIKKHQTFFDITYEHVNYFTLKTFQKMFSNKIFLKKKVFNNQYLLIIAKLSNLKNNFNSTAKYKTLSISKIFPSLFKKINSLNKIEQNIFIWGAGTKGLMFAIYLKILNPKVFKKIKFAIDIDKKKHDKFLQIVDLKIISPNKLLKTIKTNDTLIVSNSNYLKEIQSFIKKKTNTPIFYKCID